MKILPNFIKNEILQPHVKIANYYTKSNVSDALDKLQSVKGVFESGAKHNGVSLIIDKANNLISDESLISKDLKKLLDRSIALKATNNLTGKNTTMLIDVSQDTFHASIPKKVSIGLPDKSSRVHNTEFHHEDNMCRAAFRVFDRLIKLVTK